ncbi:MAG: 50S ribosomal protein L21e [Promethearchaeota archaeon]|nr:MAG: 50S ribosomal protein L21e [Candidatus Lokiarchaeota archaeon]
MGLNKGYRNRTRQRYRKTPREKGLGSIEKYLIDYQKDDIVDIIADPSKHKRGMPHRRYHGKTGTILGQRGRCYLVNIRVGGSRKTLIVGREHLRLNTSANQN